MKNVLCTKEKPSKKQPVDKNKIKQKTNKREKSMCSMFMFIMCVVPKCDGHNYIRIFVTKRSLTLAGNEIPSIQTK